MPLAFITRGTTGKRGVALNAGTVVDLDPDTHAKLWSTKDIRNPRPEELTKKPTNQPTNTHRK